MSRKLGALTLLDPSGPAWPVGDDFTFLYLCILVYLCDVTALVFVVVGCNSALGAVYNLDHTIIVIVCAQENRNEQNYFFYFKLCDTR